MSVTATLPGSRPASRLLPTLDRVARPAGLSALLCTARRRIAPASWSRVVACSLPAPAPDIGVQHPLPGGASIRASHPRNVRAASNWPGGTGA